MPEMTPELAAQLAELAGFQIAEGQVEKRAAQVTRQVREFGRVRSLPLGAVPPAVPWIRLGEE